LVYGALAYLVYKAVTVEGDDADEPKKRPRKKVPPGPPPHEVLGIAADASPKEIRRAYQKKVRAYHPDRVAGAAGELQDLATKRTKELNAAYEAMMRRAESSP
jgi:DnaJ-class molecular chaperone